MTLLGPRQVGTTTLALEIGSAHDALYLDLGSERDRAKHSERWSQPPLARGLHPLVPRARHPPVRPPHPGRTAAALLDHARPPARWHPERRQAPGEVAEGLRSRAAAWRTPSWALATSTPCSPIRSSRRAGKRSPWSNCWPLPPTASKGTSTERAAALRSTSCSASLVRCDAKPQFAAGPAPPLRHGPAVIARSARRRAVGITGVARAAAGSGCCREAGHSSRVSLAVTGSSTRYVWLQCVDGGYSDWRGGAGKVTGCRRCTYGAGWPFRWLRAIDAVVDDGAGVWAVTVSCWLSRHVWARRLCLGESMEPG